jgi:hypothetical protein
MLRFLDRPDALPLDLICGLKPLLGKTALSHKSIG